MGLKYYVNVVFMIVLHLGYSLGYERSPRETALVQVILYEPDPRSGRYSTHKTDLIGYFATVGPSRSAEGDIVQIHPQSLCDDSSDDDLFKYGWVGVVQLEDPSVEPAACFSVLKKAKRALEKGATAVIFDVTNYPDARWELHTIRPTADDRPIIYIQGMHAVQLMNIVQDKQLARARIQKKPDTGTRTDNSSDENIRMAVFMGLFFVVIVICVACVVKFRRTARHAEPSLPDGTQLRTRKYRSHHRHHHGQVKCGKGSECSSMSSSVSECAICLEEFSDGQVLRIVPCSHEFHKKCLDQWLKERLSCPLCNYDILRSAPYVCPSVQREDSLSSSGASTPEAHQLEVCSTLSMTAFPAPIYGRYRACTADNADIRLAGTHFAYADLYCESRSAAVPPHSSKSPLAVTRVSTAHHAQLCQTSASNEFRCCGPHTSLWREHAAAEYRGAGPTAHRHWRPRCGHSPPVCGPMPFPVRDKDGFLSSDSDLPPAYETLPAYSPPQNPTIATLTINGDVITTSLPQMFRHPHCVTRSPSLASGYLPDDVSDGNGSDCTFTGCAQGSSRLTDTSVRSLFGSSSLSETRTNFSESSQENLNLSDLKTNDRSATPFIGYSSSDGAEGLIQLNDSSLEDALESIDIPTQFQSRDLVYQPNVPSPGHLSYPMT